MTDKRSFMDIGDARRLAASIPPSPVAEVLALPDDRAIEDRALATAKRALQLAGAALAAQRFAMAARAQSSWRGYARDFAAWARWAEDAGETALPAPPPALALYIAELATSHKPATISRLLAAIRAAHVDAGLEDPSKAPAVKAVLAGIRRELGVAPRRKTALVVAAMRAVLAQCGDDARGRRDRLLLLVGWGAALRRSELVALDLGDVAEQAEGLAVVIRRGKTDQEARGRVVGIPHTREVRYDPVAALHEWLAYRGGRDGPLLWPVDRYGKVHPRRLDDRTVARVVKRVAHAAALEGDYSGHSLRAGFATAAAAAGAPLPAIMRQTGHRSTDTLMGYIRPATIWQENAAAMAAL